MTIATSFGFLTACSSNTQVPNQSPNDVVTDINSNAADHTPVDNRKQGEGMDHSTMELGPADAELDLRLIDSMIPHHEGAIVMAKAVLQNSKRPELKKLAQAVIKAQEQEIQQMRQWRKAWYPKAPKNPVAWHGAMGHSMEMSAEQIKAMRMDIDLGATDPEFDKRFIDAMIPHHEGAIVMAKDVLQKSKRPEVLQLARNILASQQAEIDQMKQWRKAWYGK
ncbi:MAG: DUF305 domain-containing protein [Leptolyngbyaceae cyanobacterium bins.59]|nr:DUF305 domain-containing protein [Leptolyngbyaceae cyanobacterium bins.59]